MSGTLPAQPSGSKRRSDGSLSTMDVAPPRLAPSVQATLQALRHRIRRYVWVQGLGWLAASLGLAFWLSLAVDWVFEPPKAGRVAILAVAAVAIGWVFIEMILRRAFVRLSNRSLAVLLERRFPQFNESLVTAVELTDHDRKHEAETELSLPATTASRLHAHMLAETCRQAAEPVGQIDLGKVFNPSPLRRGVVAGMVLAATIAIFAAVYPSAVSVWTRRSLFMADELWPRKTRLLVEGFENGKARVARGADLTVVAKADLSMPLVPAVVKVRYRTAGGSRHQGTMAREGTGDPLKDRYQEYSHTFRGVLAPVRLDVVGGDDAVRGLEIEVVDNPAVLEMTLDCHFPDYMQRRPRTLPVAGAMPIPVGCKVTIEAKANKDLERVQIDLAEKETPEKLASLDMSGQPDRRTFRYSLADFRSDTTLLFTLHDADGIKSREPMRLTLIAVADEPPELAVRLQGIGSAITTEAMLPAVGRVSDDHGIGQIWFEHSLNQEEPLRLSIASPSGNPTDFELQRVLDCRTLLPKEVSPGEQFLVCVKAADRYDLNEKPNVGTSERWLLDVVTPQQLRTMLESRELVLRQRFEAILTEATATRNLLAGIQFNKPASPGEATPPADEENTPTEGSEPGDRTEAKEEESPQRLVGLRTLQVQRTIQNSQKDAHEVLSVAVGFEGIREELINNRIDTEELKYRLQQGIAEPLRRVVERGYPRLDGRLAALLDNLNDEAAASKFRDQAVADMDGIIATMNAVLAKMIELEDFNEAIALLREIIEAQEKLHQQTEQVHKEKLRGLLED